MPAQLSPRGCSTLTFGCICLVTGGLFCLAGLLWHFPRVTRTDSVIVASVAVAGGQNARLITYEYAAYGVRHRGQRLFQWGRSTPKGFFEAGEQFPVYFVTDKPDLSYAPYPPQKSILVVPGIMFAALGVTVTLFAWRARHLTTR